MSSFHGRHGKVKVGASVVAEVTSFSVEESVETSDNTAMGSTAKTHLIGVTSWTASIETLWDDTDSNGQEAMTIGASISVALLPEGDTTGDDEISGTGTVKGVSVGASKDGANTRTFNIEGNGALAHDTAA